MDLRQAQTRRWFLQRMGGIAGATAFASALPQTLRSLGVDPSPAFAQEADLTLDTFNGLAAMMWPGDDAYSVAQGESRDGDGAIAADAGRLIMEALDFFVPAPDDLVSNDETVRISDAAAGGLNAAALSVNPVAAGGFLLSPFARLSFDEKLAAYRVLEEDARTLDPSGDLSVVSLLYGLLPGFVAFFGFSEAQVFDPATKTLVDVPVGWRHTGYQDGRKVPVEGWDEFTGYWKGRRSAEPSTDAMRGGAA